MSIGSILSIAKSGLQVQQRAMHVTAHNLANASTEGYARQRANIAARPALDTPQGALGTGAGMVDVERIADPLLDQVFRRETSASSEHGTRAATMARIEGILGEPSDTGLAAALDQFFSSFSELGANPTDTTVRAVVRRDAQYVADKLNGLAENLDVVRQDATARLETGVTDMNAMTRDIADLNRHIVAAEADGTTASDLRDSRARLLDRLSTLGPIKVSERSDGAVGVSMSGVSVVDGAYSSPLEIRTVGGNVGLALVGRPGLVQTGGGSLGGLMGVLNTDVPQARQVFDDIAANLVDQVNTAHRTGTNPLGNTGVDFFDPATLTSSSISLSGAVLADSRAIAAGTPDGAGNYRAGATDVAEAIAALRDGNVAVLGDSLLGHYRGLVSSVGSAVRSASDTAESHGILAEQAAIRRESLSGVSVDEELVRMIQFQTAYQSAARMVTAADEMLQSLLAI
ncbi:MAG: flagellar hook-associated protein FlgK [Longimicrobiales bacterium]